MLYKQRKSQGGGGPGGRGGGNRVLISVTILGSAGPIRFVIGEKEMVGAVIEMTLKSYAREGRLPALGSDSSQFMLYSPLAGAEAMSPWEAIGSFGIRNFMLFKKPRAEKLAMDEEKQVTIMRKGNNSWKEWFNKSLNLKVSSH